MSVKPASSLSQFRRVLNIGSLSKRGIQHQTILPPDSTNALNPELPIKDKLRSLILIIIALDPHKYYWDNIFSYILSKDIIKKYREWNLWKNVETSLSRLVSNCCLENRRSFK